MIKIALFNHKGGVGKTTLTVNIADALADLEKSVLIVDADPQCNITSFYMDESRLEELLGESGEDGSDATVWSALKPVVEGRGDVGSITPWEMRKGIHLLPGDVLMSDYEEELPTAWTECFARRQRGYSVTTALSRLVNNNAESLEVDVVLYDVGPNVGALNRVVILDCDLFITPVAADLFSLRALSTVGRSVAKWIADWQTIRSLASPADRESIFEGLPTYGGYITSAFKVHTGRSAANPHADWEKKIAPRVRDRVVSVLGAVNPDLIPNFGGNKVGGVKHFHSLAPEAQKYGFAIGKLRGYVNPGHYATVDDARSTFAALAREIVRRAGI
ncbi:ParA family protein [Phenylobacterium sp.]|uniref:ParA family protein n=1 Tax=Phenylobacterium sp. TaxID=1871053 RepID=UPI00301E5FF8